MVSNYSHVFDCAELAECFAQSIGSSAFGESCHIDIALTLVTLVGLVGGLVVWGWLVFDFILYFFWLFECLVVLTVHTVPTLSLFYDQPSVLVRGVIFDFRLLLHMLRHGCFSGRVLWFTWLFPLPFVGRLSSFATVLPVSGLFVLVVPLLM